MNCLYYFSEEKLQKL